MTTPFKIGQKAALEKFAARRGVIEIRKALGMGNMAQAQRLATTPGVIKATNTMGSHIKDLGAGSEGLASLVAHPEHGIAVRKMFDPNGGAYSNTVIQRKEQLGSLPGSAKFLGSAQSPANTPVHFNEYVQGTSLTPEMLKSNPQLASQYMKSMRASHAAAKQQGFKLRDTRPGNAIATPNGEVKLIDSIPMKAEDLASPAEEHRNRKRHGRGAILLNNTTPVMQSTDKLKNNLTARANQSDRFKQQILSNGRMPNGGIPTLAPLGDSLPMLPPLGDSKPMTPLRGNPTVAQRRTRTPPLPIASPKGALTVPMPRAPQPISPTPAPRGRITTPRRRRLG